MPGGDPGRQISLLRVEAKRLATRLEQREADLTQAAAREERLQTAFDIAMAERDKIFTSKAWRATRAVQGVMEASQRVLAPVRRLVERLRPRPSAPSAQEPIPPPPAETPYQHWVGAYDTLSQADREAILVEIGRFRTRPVISIVIPNDGADEARLEKTIASVRNQLYPDWELSVGRGSAVTGAFVALLEPGDILPEHALYEIAHELQAHPDTVLVYTDEDRIDAAGNRSGPVFKPAFSIDLQLASPLTGSLSVYDRSLFDEIGISPHDVTGSEKPVLALRAALHRGSAQVRHIPAILCHHLTDGLAADEKATPDPQVIAGLTSAAKAMADIQITPLPGKARWNRILWPLPAALPRVSVIIPTRDRADLLARCVLGLLYRTDYPDLEILIVNNDSIEAGTMSLFAMLQADGRVRILDVPGAFNYSALNNTAAVQASGDILLLLNNDIDVIEGGWLKEMVSHAVRPDVGAVGAKLIYADGRIQHAGVVLGVGEHNAGPRVAGHFGYHAEADDPGYLGQFALTREVSAVTGACLALRREVYERVGGLNEAQLPVSFNDVDLCLRIAAGGLRIVWTPFATLYHLESASRGLAETAEKIAAAAREADYMRGRWGACLDNEPFYNPAFDRKNHEFQLALPPNRVKPWRRGLGSLSPGE
jgi:O-antigen biosynthesis protein